MSIPDNINDLTTKNNTANIVPLSVTVAPGSDLSKIQNLNVTSYKVTTF
jgi:hypothetical protein